MEETFDLPRQQYFSLPPNIVYHLWRNPLSPNGLQKLYQTCKYFFAKKRVPIVFHGYLWRKAIANFHMETWGALLNHIELPKHLAYWFDNHLLLNFYHNNIYRCTIKELELKCHSITINEFKIITKENTIQRFYKMWGTINYLDGKAVSMDAVLENLPNLVELSYNTEDEPHSLEILKRMNELKFWNKFKYFELVLNNTSDTLNPTLLCQFIQLNVKEKCCICFNNTQNLRTFFVHTSNQMFKEEDANKPVTCH